jgi:hypothetical protein
MPMVPLELLLEPPPEEEETPTSIVEPLAS